MTRYAALVLIAGSPLLAQPYVIATLAGGVPPPTPSAALAASISPTSVATDPAGSVYFSSRNAVFKFDSAGTLTRIAGNARPGFSGDGGPALSAQIHDPNGLAMDASGNLYIADTGNNRIRRISPNGQIATVASALNQPYGVAADAAGNLFIADYTAVRRLSPAGMLQTVAPCAAYSCGSTSLVGVPLSAPAIAVDLTDQVYVAVSAQVWKISPAGEVTAVAGTPGSVGGYSGEGGPATRAILGAIGGLAVNGKGELCISDAVNNRIFKIAPDGTISTLAVNLAGPSALAMDAAGNLYVGEMGNWGFQFLGNSPFYVSGPERIRKIAPSGAVATVAGNGTQAWSGDAGPAAGAQLNAPWGLALDSAGSLYISDSGNHTVRKIAANGMITTVAGTGIAGSSGDGGLATAAQLNVPLGIAVDAAGALYIAECLGSRVRKVTPDGVIATIDAKLSCPHGVAVDSAGSLYIADTFNHRIQKVTADGTTSTIAGNGAPGFSGDGGPARSAMLDAPTGMALDAAGNLYIADTGNNRIRRISPDGVIATVAGCADSFHFASDDGQPATSAVLGFPQGVAVDAGGNLYISDTQGNHIRRVNTSGIISTIAGRALYGFLAYYDGNLDLALRGYSGDGGPAITARLGSPYSLAVDAGFNVYAADLPNGAVRELAPSPIANAASLLPGPIAPGEDVTLFVPAGDQVFFNGLAASVISASPAQISVTVPAISGITAAVEVHSNGRISAAFDVPVVPVAPGLFTADSTGRGVAVAIDSDGSYNSLNSSANVGETVTLFATGDDATQSATVTIGGRPAQILSRGPAPGLPGVTRIEVQVPLDALSSITFLEGYNLHVPVAVVLEVGGVSSQAALYITVMYVGTIG